MQKTACPSRGNLNIMMAKMMTRVSFYRCCAVLAAVVCATGVDAAPDESSALAKISPKVRAPSIPRRSVNLSDFGGAGDGRTLNTDSFAKAIAELSRKGGGKLVVPPGIWLTGPIRLQSRINLHLERGALIQFSGDCRLYPLTVLDVKGEKDVESVSPISGENLESVAITGEGVIDGGGGAWRPVKKSKLTEGQWKELIASGGVLNEKGDMWWPSRDAMQGETLVRQLQARQSLKLEDYEPARQFLRPKMLKLINCRRVLFEGVTFQNSPNWALHPLLCEDLLIRNVTVRNPWFSQNGDGLDLESCRRAIVRDCSFDVGDDAICIKSGKDAAGRRIGVPTEDVLIERCTVYHGHGGLTIGSEMSGGVRNVRVQNCVFIGTDVGLRFKSTRGRGGVVEKIYIDDIRMTDIPGDAINFNLYYGGKAPLDEAGELAVSGQQKFSVSEDTPQFRDIYIRNVVCRGAEAAMVLQGLPEMPIRGIHLRNVSISSRTGGVLMDADQITFENVEIANHEGPVLNLFDTRRLLIDRLTYPAGATAVLKAQGDSNRGIVIRNTNLKAAQKDFVLGSGASAEAFQVE
jgi:polygalacturonase